MAGADRKNHLGSHCYNPKRENSSPKQDDSNGGEEEWVNSRSICKMESIGYDGLVAGAIPREMHLWMFTREFYLCMYKNNYRKFSGVFIHFLFIPSFLHVNEYARKCYLKLQRVKKKVDSEAYSKSITRSMHHGVSQAEVVNLHGVSMSCGRFCPRLATQGCLYSI